MSTEPASWGNVLFCDDIRFEISNKWSLIGIYGGEFIIDADFPVLIPRLVVMTDYYELFGNFDDDLELNIYMPHDDTHPYYSAKIPRSLQPSEPAVSSDPDVRQVAHVRAPVTFNQLVLQKEGTIKVRMHCGDEIVRIGALNVRRARGEESGMFSSGMKLFQSSPKDATN